jgi:uncharacterized protein YdaU (DUF1376 family)
MNYYERHLGDYAKDTAHLSMLEHGAYNLLLDRYYATESGIPADQIYRIARAKNRAERSAVDAVLREFFALQGGVWIKNRCEEEISGAKARIEASRLNGKRGGRPRKNLDETQEKPSGFSLGSETETQTKALQSPVSSLQSPEDSRRGEAPPVGTLKTQIYRLARQIEIDPSVVTNELKAHSEKTVWQALGATVAARPADALPYFRGCLKGGGSADAAQRKQIP